MNADERATVSLPIITLHYNRRLARKFPYLRSGSGKAEGRCQFKTEMFIYRKAIKPFDARRLQDMGCRDTSAGYSPFRIVVEERRLWLGSCLLYTSDAADDLLCVDLGGRR